MRKGFYFSFDALMALTVMSASLFVVIQSSDVANDPYSSSEIDYRQSTITGQDALKLASDQNFNAYFNDSYRQQLVDNTVMNSEDMDRTIVDGIALMWAAQNKTYAKKTAKLYFESKVPDRYGYRIQVGETNPENVLYNTSKSDMNSSVVTSTSRLVSGHEIGEPSEGYQARMSLSSVTKEETKTKLFGGYVGDGRITYNISLPDLHTVKNVTTEGDFSGPFDLYINGEDSGSYTPNHDNLSASYFSICTNELNEARCEALESGNNQIEYRFIGSNQSIGGGLIKITYNRTTTIQPPGTGYQQKTKRLPGIEGVINYYGGSYVPGDVKGANAHLHYETDNQTFFVRIGNSTIYEKRTIGEQTVNLDNKTIYNNLSSSDYKTLSRETVPVRAGLKNLDQIYSRAIADSVSVIDDSGSMGGSKMVEAKDSSKTFVDIILNATGNRAGVVGYDSQVSDVHKLSTDKESLKNTIDDLDAGGGTCIACGILRANEIVEEGREINLVSKKSLWKFNNSFRGSRPPDKNGYNWTELDYNDTSWDENRTIIGGSPSANTQIETDGNVYFRRNFYVDPSLESNLSISVRSDDAATVYLNSHLVDNDTGDHDAEYWNTKTGESFISSIDKTFQDSFERNNLESKWSVTSGSEGSETEIGETCGAADKSKAVLMKGGGTTVESNIDFNSGNYQLVFEYSLKQGGDGGDCETPDAGEDVYVEYLDSSNNWNTLETHEGEGNNPSQGEWSSYSSEIPKSEFHEDIEIRFRYPNYDGNNYDFWAFDNVSLTAAETKSLPEIPSEYVKDGKNVVAAKLKNDGEDTRNLVKSSASDWNEGQFENTTGNTGSLQLGKTGFDDIFSDNSLGANWNTVDNDGSSGTSIQENNERITIDSNGADTWTGDDKYASVYREDITGSWNATVKLVSQENTNSWAKSGIMVKNDLTSSASSTGYVFMVGTPGNGYSFQWDSDNDGYLDQSSTVDSVVYPSKLRLQKNGDTFTGYYSKDGGSSWTEVETQSIGSAENVQEVGLSHTSHSSGTLGKAVFDDFYLGSDMYEKNGYYRSGLIDMGKTVGWRSADIQSSLPPGTDYSINYSDNNNWYESLNNLPDSRYLKYNISFNTGDVEKTPSIDKVNLSYEASIGEFDLKVSADQKRKNSMIVMSDGEPSYGADGGIDDTGNCPIPGVGSFYGSEAATIEAAYRSNQELNTTIYTVGFGSGVNEDLMNMTARCGGGKYYYAETGTEELENVFRNISNNILNASFVGQTVETNEEEALGQIYPDSHITFNYTDEEEGEYGSIELQQSSERFGGSVRSPKNGTFTVPEGVEPVSGRITSYSGNRWTDRASINTSGSMERFYELWKYDAEYRQLGDPFKIQIPSSQIENGVSKVQVDTALDKSAPGGGSPDNKVFYKVRVNGSVGYGTLFENKSFAEKDAEERLFEKLDVDNDGSPEVSADSENIDLSSSFTKEQPYVWGPAILKLVVWE